jgi:hypothetical protein
MKLEITEKLLKDSKLTPNKLYLLLLLYHQKFNLIIEIFGKQKAIEIRDSLTRTDFILSDDTTKFTETLLSKRNIEKLFGIRADVINFWEFYNIFPVKVGSRVLRASGPTTQLALKHQKKYLERVKTIEQHQLAIQATEAFVAKKKQMGELKFLPMMETVLNNNMWENWGIFVEESEEREWNTESI